MAKRSRRLYELKESQVDDDKGKRFIRNVKALGDGEITVYLWNQEKSAHVPIGLLVDPNHVATTCLCLEEMGAPRTDIKDGKKYDLTTVTGFQGANMEVYDTGRIIVQCPRGKRGAN